jgi:hypothetical protein
VLNQDLFQLAPTDVGGYAVPIHESNNPVIHFP